MKGSAQIYIILLREALNIRNVPPWQQQHFRNVRTDTHTYRQINIRMHISVYFDLCNGIIGTSIATLSRGIATDERLVNARRLGNHLALKAVEDTIVRLRALVRVGTELVAGDAVEVHTNHDERGKCEGRMDGVADECGMVEDVEGLKG